MKPVSIIMLVALLSCGPKKQNESEKKTVPVLDKSEVADSIPPTKEEPEVELTASEKALGISLKNRFGNKWNVLNDKSAKWMKDAYDYFIAPKRKDDPDYPYICFGDFNNDGKKDTAALVVEDTGKNFRMVILQEGKTPVFWEEDIMEGAALSRVHKSTVQGMKGEKEVSVTLPGDAIQVEYFERGAFLVYWDKKGFKRLQTAD